MHVVIIVELVTIVSSILDSNINCNFFFHMNSILHKFYLKLLLFLSSLLMYREEEIGKVKKFDDCRWKGKFDQYVFAMGNNFKTKYEQFLEVYNGLQHVIFLINNVVTTSKRNRYLKAQHYTIFTKVVDEGIQNHFL